jgi:hypothetical protein
LVTMNREAVLHEDLEREMNEGMSTKELFKANDAMLRAWAQHAQAESRRTGLSPWKQTAAEIIQAAEQLGMDPSTVLNDKVREAIASEMVVPETAKAAYKAPPVDMGDAIALLPKKVEDEPVEDVQAIPDQSGGMFGPTLPPKRESKHIKLHRGYVIGSLKNPEVVALAKALRMQGYDIFDDWYSPGPETDEYWQEHEKIGRGRTFQQALDGAHAWNVFNFDTYWLNWADFVVMAMPCGKSGHLEFGYSRGRGKPGFILLQEEPERWDVMYRFGDKVCMNVKELLAAIADVRLIIQPDDPRWPHVEDCR